MRTLTYSEAICEAHRQALAGDPRVFVMGQGVDNPWCVGTTTRGLAREFGRERVRDVPISENCMTGAAIGAAMAGMRPIVFHPRMDFMYLAMDSIVNHCAHWCYMFGGKVTVPVTIRGIINRGNEQAAQHSQSPYAMYAHVPGLSVVLPATPADAKGLLLAAVASDNPVLYIDDRWLYDLSGEVPAEPYVTPIGKATIRRPGSHLTIAALSYLVPEAMLAAEALEKEGIEAEVIDLRSAKPLDSETVIESVKKTKRLVVADPAWPNCGIASELSSRVYTALFGGLLAPIAQITLPDCPAPANSLQETAYYPRSREVAQAARAVMNGPVGS